MFLQNLGIQIKSLALTYQTLYLLACFYLNFYTHFFQNVCQWAYEYIRRPSRLKVISFYSSWDLGMYICSCHREGCALQISIPLTKAALSNRQFPCVALLEWISPSSVYFPLNEKVWLSLEFLLKLAQKWCQSRAVCTHSCKRWNNGDLHAGVSLVYITIFAHQFWLARQECRASNSTFKGILFWGNFLFWISR